MWRSRIWDFREYSQRQGRVNRLEFGLMEKRLGRRVKIRDGGRSYLGNTSAFLVTYFQRICKIGFKSTKGETDLTGRRSEGED